MVTVMRCAVGLAMSFGVFLLFVAGDVAGDTLLDVALKNPWHMALGLLCGAILGTVMVRKK